MTGANSSPSSNEDIGLADVVEKGILGRRSLDGRLQRYRPSSFDFDVLDVADAAIMEKVPTALVLPVAGAYTSVLLAAAMLIHDFVRSRTLGGQVALVTKQLVLRSFYDGLCLRSESLRDYFPRTIVSAGRVTDVGEVANGQHARPGRIHFASSLENLKAIPGTLDGVVIEGPAATKNGVARLIESLGGHVPIIYGALDPFDPALELFERRGVVWAWDSAWLEWLLDDASERSAICAEIERLRGASHTEYAVVGPEENNGLDSALKRIWEDLATVQRHPGEVTFEALGWVWGVYGGLSHLAVPLQLYDKMAARAWKVTQLSEAATKAEMFARNAPDPDTSDYWQVLAADLETAVGLADEANHKPDLLRAWVRERIESNTTGLIITRNKAAVEAVAEFLQRQPVVPLEWRTFISLGTISDFRVGRLTDRVDSILLTGPVSSRDSGLIALPTAGALTVLGHGPWEASRAMRQIVSTGERLAELAHGDIRDRARARLKISPFEAPPPSPRPVRISRGTGGAVPDTPKPTAGPTWDPFDVDVVGDLGRWDEDSEGPAPAADGQAEENVEVLIVEVDEGRCFFEPNHLISVVVAGDVEDMAAKSLYTGSRFLLVDRTARRGLFDVIVEKLEQMPEFRAPMELVREWQRRALYAGVKHQFDYGGILARMRPETHITDPRTVYNWVWSVVMGPGDVREIRTFGRAVGDPVLEEGWEPIGMALRTLRSHRKKVGRMLGAVLTGGGTAGLEDQGYFDRRLGIHYTDLLEAVTVHKVLSVSGETITVGYHYANRLLSDEEAGLVEQAARKAD